MTHKIHPDKRLKNEVELEHSIQSIAKMYTIRDREAVEPLFDPQTREDMVESTVCMIRKIEGEVAEYLARKYGYIAEPAEEVSVAHRALADVPTEQAA